MTYLLLQTFLLLLSAYFAGALSACLVKRSMLARSAQMAAVTARTAAIETTEHPEEIVPLAKPREIDPVQPRIEILPRPARKVVPTEAQVDISRFDRALTGPDPNEGMPRKMLVEIRPAILKSPTGPAKPFKKPEPKVEAPKPEPAKPDTLKAEPAKPDTAKPDAQKPAQPTGPAVATPAQAAASQAADKIQGASAQKPSPAPETKPVAAEPKKDVPPSSPAQSPQPSAMSAGIAGASAAAAAAVAAAKAAAAAVVPRPVQPAPEPQKPVAETKPVEPAKPSAPAPAPAAAVTEKSAPAPIASPQQTAAPKPAEMQPAAKPSAPAGATPPAAAATAQQPAAPSPVSGPKDDLLRIRAIDPETERRLQSIGITRFEHIAHWTPADINRINQAVGLGDRIDREQWIEQAQILAKGGETYYSRNRASIAKPNAAPAAAPSPAPAANPQPAVTPAATAAAPPKPASEPAPSPAPAAPSPQPSPQSQAPAAAAPAAPAPNAPPANAQPASGAATALQGKSVADMASAAAAAIAAASASVTRGIRPIEPISPMTRANPNIVMPAKLSDALKDNESKAPTQAAAASPPKVAPAGKTEDLKRIRGVGVLIEKRLNTLGVTTYSQVANWTSGDIDRISQTLDFKGRIERENWVEQARILSSGGQTEFSRRVDRGDVETSRDETD